MLIYILKSTLCMLVFLAFYILFLKNENWHVFKRFYLLSIVLLALILPVLTFTVYVDLVPQSYNNTQVLFETQRDLVVGDLKESLNGFNYSQIALNFAYALGVIWFSVLFCKNLGFILNKIKRGVKLKSSKVVKVLLKEKITPHTFLNYIFLNQQRFESNAIPKEVLWHEEIHVKQLHTIDVLLMELLQVIFWFNPIINIVKKEIKLNHEFLADKGVLNKGVPINFYQTIVLQYSNNQDSSILSNAINYSSIKKRFTVMKTKTSNTKILLRTILLLPLLALAFYSFSSKEEVYLSSVNSKKEQNQHAKLTDTKAYYYKNVTFHIINRNGNVADMSFFELPQTIKDKLVYPTLEKRNLPTKNQLENWRDAKYGIWIDGVRVKNNNLQKYNAKDFSNYFVSKLHPNARNYGKHFYQINLTTNQLFEEQNRKGIVPLDEEVVVTIKTDENDELKTLGKKTSFLSTTLSGSTSKLSQGIKNRKKITLRVENNVIYLNGVEVALSNFSGAIDNYTANWEVDDFKLFKLDIKTKDVSNDFIIKLNQEYRKSTLSKQSNRKNDYIVFENNFPKPPTFNYHNVPSPKHPIEHIKTMDKRNAIFKFNGNSITANEAVSIIKNNKTIKINTELNDPKPPIVVLLADEK